MRWAEGHTHNVKKFFPLVMASPNISLREKLEFLYYAPYYLQSVFFIMGTACWFLSEIIMHGKLPYWTSLFGWSLVFTNMGALALMNLSGLFMERGVKHEWGGVLSAMLLSIVLVPFQAYAALKGLLAAEEGGWFRTPKSGKITEFFDRLDLGGKLRWLLPRRRGRRRKGRVSKATDVGGFSWLTRRRSRLTQGLISVMLAGVLTLGSLAVGVPAVSASDPQNLNWYLHPTTAVGGGMGDAGEDMSTIIGSAGSPATTVFTAKGTVYWYSVETYPIPPVVDGVIPDVNHTFHLHWSATGFEGDDEIQVKLEINVVDATTGVKVKAGPKGEVTLVPGDLSPYDITLTQRDPVPIAGPDYSKRIQVKFQIKRWNNQDEGDTFTVEYDQGSSGSDTYLLLNGIIVPERALALLLVAPFLPLMARRFRRAKGAGMVKRGRRRGSLWVR